MAPRPTASLSARMSTGVSQPPATDDATSSGAPESDFDAQRHVYEPHRVGLPPLGPYVRELWRRREFALELSRTDLRSQHFNTVFGQAWLVLNPLLLVGVYFVLVDILQAGSRGTGFFAHLMAALFAYYFVNDAVRRSIRSVTAGGRLILNTSFPRTLLPLSSVVTAFKRFLPTLAIYVPVHFISDRPVSIELLWLLPIIVLLVLLASGLAMIVSAAQVYFRDLKDFLPYALRVWLYASPVLYYAHEVPERYQAVIALNPLGPLLTAWSDVIDNGAAPDLTALAGGAAWAIGLFVAGALFFISREREFAVRL
jgi:ABC-type polysaccharide/polyol phosphate export permease